MINVDAKAIQLGTGCTPSTANAFLDLIVAAMRKFDINTPRRVAAFLANVSEESEQLTMVRENMNYSASGLARVWPARFAVDRKATTLQPNAKALALARRPVDIANEVYANRLGNGPVESGDGWMYRGVGWIQATGKTNIQAALAACGLGPNQVDLLETPQYAALSAAYIWKKFGCNELADKDMFSATVKTINGAPPSKANEGPQRLARYRACVPYLNRLNDPKGD